MNNKLLIEKGIQLHAALMDVLIASLEPRYDEQGNRIPVPAALVKEIREFLKDNSIYTMDTGPGSAAEELLGKATELFKTGVYHN